MARQLISLILKQKTIGGLLITIPVDLSSNLKSDRYVKKRSLPGDESKSEGEDPHSIEDSEE